MTPKNIDTDTLLAKTAAGDASAGNRLLRRYRSRLVKMVAMRIDHRLRARCDPSDVVQEALLTATARIELYAHERPIPFYPWLRKIAFEHLIKFHEKHIDAQKRAVEREVRMEFELNDQSVERLANKLAGRGGPPSEDMMKTERRRRVRKALASMRPRDREVIELRYLEHLESTEVAAVLGISVAAERTRHFRAIQRLQLALGSKEL